MRGWAWWPVLALGALVPLGCAETRPQPADPGRAREALRQVLDAWQKGEPLSAQPVTVGDRRWQGGYRLLRYEVGEDRPAGYDLQCRVALTLRDPRGRTVRERALYSVSTHPGLVVVRADED